MTIHLTPLEVCERLIGDIAAIAVVCGLHPKSPFFWRRPSKFRAAGDIPSLMNRALLAYSDAHALGLTPAHLILGASDAEVAAILATRQTTEQPDQAPEQTMPSQASDQTRLVA